MPQHIDCPICPRREIPPGVEICPGCGADLSPLVLLAELPLVYCNRALEYHARGDPQGAVASAGCALALEPRCAAAAILLGKLLWHSGRKEQALAHWSEVAEREPDNTEAARLLAAAEKKTGLPGRQPG